MVFGIDVGGTTVKIGLVENDKILDKYEIRTCGETFIADICNSLKKYMKEHNIDKIDGIGFGLPGNVINNYIYNLPNMGVKNVDLVKEVSAYFPGVKIEGQNDANVAALGEMLYHNEYKSACMLTLGTGVGAGIVVDKLGYYIAKCMSILSVTVDVDVFYVGGGVSKAGDILINTIKKHYANLSHFAVKNVKIEAAQLLNDAGMLGAAGLVK